jgi:hypothetical protein
MIGACGAPVQRLRIVGAFGAPANHWALWPLPNLLDIFPPNQIRRKAASDQKGKMGRIARCGRFAVTASVLLLAATAPALGHHSFAVYDFTQQIPFEGVVATLSFRNPHIALTLTHTLADGSAETIHFAEGAPANMNVRNGLLPDMIKPGSKITAIGSPRKDDPHVFFLRKVVLENGREFSSTSN